MSTTGLPVDLSTVVLIALLNPAFIAVGLWMGTKADEPQKLLIAAFAAAIAGVALIWLGAELRIAALAKPARATAGIFVLQILFGMVWAWIGYRFLRHRSGSR